MNENQVDLKKSIQEKANSIGKYGEQVFSDWWEVICPGMLGISEEYYRENYSKFRLYNVVEEHGGFDFAIRTPHDGDKRIEVKTRSCGYVKQAVIEYRQGSYIDKNGIYHCAKDGWFATSTADYFIFVYLSEDKERTKITSISSKHLRRLVEEKKYLKVKSNADKKLEPDTVSYIPIKDIEDYAKQHKGENTGFMTGYSSPRINWRSKSMVDGIIVHEVDIEAIGNSPARRGQTENAFNEINPNDI